MTFDFKFIPHVVEFRKTISKHIIETKIYSSFVFEVLKRSVIVHFLWKSLLRNGLCHGLALLKR